MKYEYECPKCENYMEQVEFSDGHAKPDGFPGLLCNYCHFSVAGDEELFNYLFDN